MRVPIDSIYFGTRSRKDYGSKELEDLKQDLLTNGQITAITISKVPQFILDSPDYNGEAWLLIAGGRRTMAASLAGWKDIAALEREAPTELEYRIWELHENLKRKAMDWQEETFAKAEIFRLRKIQDPTLTASDMAAELGESTATFSRDVETAKLLVERPNLKKTGSKHAALKAGKELQKHEAKLNMQRDSASRPDPATLAFGPLERRIVTADAVDFVRTLPDNSIDLVLTDGPYGYDYWKQGQKNKPGVTGHLSDYDDSPEAVKNLYITLLPELIRVTRESGWLMMFAGTETFYLLQQLARDCCATHCEYRRGDTTECIVKAQNQSAGACRFLLPEPYPWIWHRPNSRNQPRHPHFHAKNVAELIFVCNLGRGQIVKQPCENVLVHDTEYGNIRIHVNQKPIDLLKDLIERVTFPGDSVLDCFFGSGNGPAAAAAAGRIPWACDSNADLLPFALGRIRENLRPITAEEISLSQERFRRALEGEPPILEVDLPENEPGLFGSTGGPFVVNRAPNLPNSERIVEQRITGVVK